MNMGMNLKTGILIVLAAHTLTASAGVGAHGGNVVSCSSKPMVTLDYYNATLPTMSGPVDLVPIETMSEGQVLQFVRSRFNGTPFQEIFDEHNALLGPMSSWISADLKSIDDSNEPYALPKDCTRMTAAARQGTEMYMDPSVSNNLSGAQLGLLHAHEILYEISRSDSSSPVRDAFRVLLAKQVDWATLNRAMEPIGILAAWEYLREGNWKQLDPAPIPVPGYFMYISGSLTLSYRDFGAGMTEAAYGLSCRLETQSCLISSHVNQRGSGPDIVGCTLKVPKHNKMTVECPQYPGQVMSFMGTSP